MREGLRIWFVIPAYAGGNREVDQGIYLFAFCPCSHPVKEAMKRRNIFTLFGSGFRHSLPPRSEMTPE